MGSISRPVTENMEPVVRLTKDCALRGVHRQSPQTKKSINAFLGIPYAEPPVNELRFQPTKSKPLWAGVRDCTEYGSIAMQHLPSLQRLMHPFQVPDNMSEDCLYLNVWTPTNDVSAKLPVMLWIHGGAFVQGYSNFYDGTMLCGYHDVVVVSINYRLGVFGFMATGDGVVKGNMGLMDQVEALKWVKQHIQNFGGDPDNITLFGESAGSISIAYHMLSPMTRGLFRRAICQSGAADYPGSAWLQLNMQKFLQKRLQKAGLDLPDGKAIVKHLSGLSSQEVLSIAGFEFQPCVDGIFLPDKPEKLYNTGYLHKDVDVIFGFNSDEGAMFIYGMNNWKPIQTKSDAMHILDSLVDTAFFRGSKHGSAIKELVRQEYFTGEDSEENWTHGLVQLYGDLLFVAPSFQSALLHCTIASGSTYVYAFEEKPTVSRYPDYIRADHAQEIMFVFGEMFLGRLPEVFHSLWSEEEKELSKKMIDMWCNFAKTGNPPAGGVSWPKFTVEKEEYLSIQQHFQVKHHYRPARLRLWNETIPALLNSKAKY